MPVLSHDNEWSCILCVNDIDFVSFYSYFLLDFGNVPTVWYFFFHFLINKCKRHGQVDGNGILVICLLSPKNPYYRNSLNVILQFSDPNGY